MDYTAAKMKERADRIGDFIEDKEIKRYLNLVMAAALEGNYSLVIKNWLTEEQIKLFQSLGYRVEEETLCDHTHPLTTAEERMFHGGRPGSWFRLCWD